MTDPVGLTASVITIAGCICLALQWLYTWGCFFYYEAEIDVKALQDLLDGTTVLLNEVSSRKLTFPNPHLDADIVRARRIVGQLKQILHQTLGVQNRSRLWRQLLWLRHSNTVSKLQLRLQTLKDEILNMSNVSLAKETEKTLLNISNDRLRHITMLQDAPSNFDQKLEALWTDLSSTSELASLGSHTATRLLDFAAELGSLEGTSHISAIPYRGLLSGSFSRNHLTHTTTSTNSFQPPSKKIDSGSEDDRTTYSVCTHPASTFELSKTFKPQKYVDRYKLPPVFVTSFYQESYSHNACINRYRILYFQSEERWVNFSISLEIPRTSSFWTITQVTKRRKPMFGAIDPFCLPASLVERLRKCFELGSVYINDNAHIKMRLTDDSICTTSKQTSTSQSSLGRSIGTGIKQSTLITERELFDWIRHTDCPRYSETEVIAWAILEFPERFAVYLGNRLARETKNIERSPSPIFCYNIQVLHSLRGVPGVLELLGVTIDANEQRVKSYLVKWPTSNCQLLLHRASSSVFPWDTIETWARRLIRAVHALHSRFFVVGTLRQQRPPILVDTYDNIYLHEFEPGIRISEVAAPFYPPEYRHYTKLYAGFSIHIHEPIVTPAYDLYQLGQILWILAESWATGRSALALKEWFYRKPDDWSGGLYTGPDPLPRLSAKVPKYYQDIVSSCCSQNPHERLPCQDLLSMFPLSDDDIEQVTNILTSEPVRVEAMQDCRMAAIACENCWKQISSRLYACTICKDSDFHLCPKCFDQGEHCMNPSHLLVETFLGGDFPIKTRFHSSGDHLGMRNIVEVD